MVDFLKYYTSKNLLINKLKNYSLYLSILFFISSLICFFAYNWDRIKKIGNVGKIMIPMSIIIIFVSLWNLFQEKELYRKIFLLIASITVGILFAVFGQVYQTGADSYLLFFSWGIFILAFSFAEKFYPILLLNILVFNLGLMFYVKDNISIHVYRLIGVLFLIIVLGTYSLIVKNNRTSLNKWFFNFLSISAIYLLKNIGIDGVNNLNENPFILLFYIIGITLHYYIEYFGIKRKKINIFSILSIIIVAIVFVVKTNSYESGLDALETIFYIICLIGAGIYIFYKRINQKNIDESKYIDAVEKNVVEMKHTKKIKIGAEKLFAKIIQTILKFAMIISIILFIVAWIFIYNIDTEMILIYLGIILIIISFILPKILKFKENRVDGITFTTGLICIIVQLTEEYNIEFNYITILIWFIFGLIYYFIYYKTLDYLVVPLLIMGLDFLDRNFLYMNISLILLFITMPFFNENERIKRIAKGGELLLLLLIILHPIFSLPMKYFNNNFVSEKIFIYLNYAVEIFILFIFLKILYQIIKNKRYIFLIGFIFVGGYIFYMLQSQGFYFNNDLWFIQIFELANQIKYPILLLYLYITRNEKGYELIGLLFLVFITIRYYYYLQTTLLIKSIELISVSIILFIVYLILQNSYKKMSGSDNI